MIELHNLIAGYQGKPSTPLINGKIVKGSMLAIIGPNGIGKSTFLKTLAGLLPPTSGELKFKKQIKSYISYLPQQNNINYNLPITVFDVVSMGCWPKINFFKKLNHYEKHLIWNTLQEVDLLNIYNYNINRLSGGQIQRMLIARILIQQSSLILLDEPFQYIDKTTCNTLISSIDNLRQKGSTIIMVVHNYKFISKYFSNILLLNQFSSIWQ